MEFADDTHLCLRCNETIVGLGNYVLHRRQHCLGVQSGLQMCKQLPDVTAPLLPNVSTQSHISANDFFTSLELQSKVPAIIPFAPIEFDSKINDVFECISPSDVPSSIFTDLKSVKNDCVHDKGEESDGDDPPPTFTGGKWKPGFNPHNRKSPIELQKPYFDINSKSCESNSFGQVHNISPGRTGGCINETHEDRKNDNSPYPSGIQSGTPIADSIQLDTRSTRNENVKSDSKINDMLSCKLCHVRNLDSYGMYLHILSKTHQSHFKNESERTRDTFKYSEIMINNSTYQCHLCLSYFNNSSAFLSHVTMAQHQRNAAQSKNNLMCLPCEFECLGNDDLCNHLSKAHYFLPYTNHPLIIMEKNRNGHCEFCKKKCTGLFAKSKKKSTIAVELPLTSHLNIASSRKSKYTNKCPFCNFFAESSTTWKSHILKDHSNKCRCLLLSETMPYGETEISDNDVLVKKMQTTSNNELCENKQFKNEKIKCLICDNIFDLGHFYMHVTIQHEENVKLRNRKKGKLQSSKFKCPKYSYKTSSKDAMVRHKTADCDKRPRPFSCSKCDATFFDKKLLNQHLKLHSTPRYQCTICKRKFYSNPELTRHMKNHSNVHPYLCDICGYRAKVPQLLKRHVRIHTKECPFKCKQCSFTAATCSQLLRHERIHSGVKPYNCPYCTYSCNTQENLRKHILKTKKHQNLKMYSCKFCTFECNMFNQYKNHLLNNHKTNFPRGEKDIISPMTISTQSDDPDTD